MAIVAMSETSWFIETRCGRDVRASARRVVPTAREDQSSLEAFNCSGANPKD